MELSPADAAEEPSFASATGISSRDSAESEWYSAGGAAAWTGPKAGARGGREALRGNAGKGSRCIWDTVDTLLGSVGGKYHNSQDKMCSTPPLLPPPPFQVYLGAGLQSDVSLWSPVLGLAVPSSSSSSGDK